MSKTVRIDPKRIRGEWREGYVLDDHTVKSIYLGDNEFGQPQYDTTRTEIGELLFRLKYRHDTGTVEPLVRAAIRHMKAWSPGVDLLLPVPPSAARQVQPVTLLGREIAKRLGVPFVADCVTRRKQVPQLKDVYDYDERLRLLHGAHRIVPRLVTGRRVLLFDDLYRSGATMNIITKALYDRGAVADVFVLAITQTRSNR